MERQFPSAFCTGRGATPWSFIRSPKWLSSAGRARKRENSSAGARVNTKPLHLDVNEQIECAQTLASKFYTDPAVLEIEKTRIFLRTWQLVGTLSHACRRSERRAAHHRRSGEFFYRGDCGRACHRGQRQAGRPTRVQQRVPAPRRNPSRWAAAARTCCVASTTDGLTRWMGA